MEEVELKDELYTIIVFLVLSISSLSFLTAMRNMSTQHMSTQHLILIC